MKTKYAIKIKQEECEKILQWEKVPWDVHYGKESWYNNKRLHFLLFIVGKRSPNEKERSYGVKRRFSFCSVLIGLQGLLRNSHGKHVCCTVLVCISLRGHTVYGQGNTEKEIYLCATSAILLLRLCNKCSVFFVFSPFHLKSASLGVFWQLKEQKLKPPGASSSFNERLLLSNEKIGPLASQRADLIYIQRLCFS